MKDSLKKTIMHAHGEWAKGNREMTLALVYDDDKNVFKVGVSWKNPKDKHFIKKVGKVKAAGYAKQKSNNLILPKDLVMSYGGPIKTLRKILNQTKFYNMKSSDAANDFSVKKMDEESIRQTIKNMTKIVPS